MVSFCSSDITECNIPSPFVIVLKLWSLLLGPGAVPTIQPYPIGYANSLKRGSNATASGVNRTWGNNIAGQIYEDTITTRQQSQEIPKQLFKLMIWMLSILTVMRVHLQVLQEMQYSEQLVFNTDTDIDITSDSNMISYEQYLKETKNTIVQDTNSSTQQEAMIMSVIEEMNNQVAKCNKVALNKLSEHFVMHFMPPKQLSAEQPNWLPISKHIFETPPVQPEPVLKEIPRELPIISLVKDSFNKIRIRVNDFENVVTARTKVTGQNEGLTKEINDIREVFNQMETELIISQDLVHTVVNTLAAIVDYKHMENSYLDEYNENLELQAKF
ncbi:hypothetical protein Tco_1146251 [Tanacetum coccineum]